jgi:hypothetical protein
MAKQYYSYYDYPGWEEHQKRLWDYRERVNPEDQAWWSVNYDTFKDDLGDLLQEFRDVGIYVQQIIYIAFRSTQMDNMDPSDASSIYIHIDSKDDEEHLQKQQDTTTFTPEYVFNIPLKNCESSETLFFEFIDPTDPNRNLGQHAWGGGCVDYNNIYEADRFKLDRPAFLKINGPHAVHNPTQEPRIVASIRIHKDSPALKDMVAING